LPVGPEKLLRPFRACEIDPLIADSGQPEVAGFSRLVVAGLVPATPIIIAMCLPIRGRRDKPGDNAGS